jgi:epoxyqueuosine reductase
VAARLADASALVRGAAVWALGRIAPETAAAANCRIDTETDPHVVSEWRRIVEIPLAEQSRGEDAPSR